MTSWLARWRLKSVAYRLFTQPFVQAQFKQTSKLCVTGLCEGNQSVNGGSPHKGPVTRKIFPFDDVIMNRMTLPVKVDGYYPNGVAWRSCCGHAECNEPVHLSRWPKLWNRTSAKAVDGMALLGVKACADRVMTNFLYLQLNSSKEAGRWRASDLCYHLFKLMIAHPIYLFHMNHFLSLYNNRTFPDLFVCVFVCVRVCVPQAC